jgi:hypothetical protein
MRTAMTIGYEHGSSKPVVISGPEVSIHDQKKAVKTDNSPTHPRFHTIEVYELKAIKSRSYEPLGAEPAPEPIAPPPAPPEQVAEAVAQAVAESPKKGKKK